jgi:hypothetical protein
VNFHFFFRLTKIVNLAITSSTFPTRLKEAPVATVHKKNSVLEAGNYKPVSVLPAMSKNARFTIFVKGFVIILV